MPSFRTSHVVKHTPDQMFDLVSDVESYPQFVPLCLGIKIKRRFPGSDGATVFVSEMEVGYKAVREKFTSRVVANRAAHRIEVTYVDGPFSHLENRWTFADAGNGACRVEFFIAYEFRNRMLATLMGGMFDAAFRKFSTAFEARADQIFGV
ncbi:coenzyme Q-binding protein COQ10 [Rhodoblastus acidophilus]|uniref:type II toxin-antitoxin system RatA family toxin n=1 Tax=Rhodoblastus acidophilus TaxID=1074 RepID=UPI0016088FD4|nr:type II toxin-antitoxin system RatA family toxin [Rhodoblastus acidophilus]MCW2286399.1 coenzyme Q-binding protein COQ10 [Rhodoblastus acidophilus]MCW2335248.1 coenzyme Q-binding protein COQ10 [Rhodoblastus acidophilus]